SAASVLNEYYPEAAKKAGLVSPAEELARRKKLDVPASLGGTSWSVYSVWTAQASTTGGSGKLSIQEETADWSDIALFLKAGKGKIAFDTSRKPPTIVLTVDQNTYKGIYKVSKASDGLVNMAIRFSAAGGDFPDGFPKDTFHLPKESK